MNTGMMTMPSGTESTPATTNGSTALATAPGADGAAQGNTALSLWQTIGVSDNWRKVLNQPSVRRVLPLMVMLMVLVVFGLVYA